MNSFLYKVAYTYYENIVNNSDNNLNFNEIAFVFPNKRSGLFFKEELKNIATKNIFIPKTFDINSLVLHSTNKVIANDIELLLTLYNAYCEIKGDGKNIEELNKFTNIGFSLIKDFDEIDKYLVDTDIFFKNIKDLQDLKKVDYLSKEQKEAVLEFFNFDTDKEINKNYFSLWRILGDLYNNYKQKLLNSGKAYYGMLYREYTDNLKNPTYNDPLLREFKRVVFVGFNFLTKSEEAIFKYFNNNKIGDFYFDYPTIYENGDYFRSTITTNYRKNLAQFKSRYPFTQETEIRFPSVDIYNASTQSGQIHIANQLISNIKESKKNDLSNNESDENDLSNNKSKKNDLSDTVILLPNEGILTSLLEYIPIDIEHLNITMGYPLNTSILSMLMNNITSMHLNKREDKTEDGNISEISYHYKDIMSIISNQYIKQIAPQFCNEISNVILKNNFILVSESKIKEITNRYPEETIITAIFPSNDSLTIDTPKAFSKYLQGILTELISQYSEITDTIEGENEEVSDVTLQSENNDIDSNFLLQYKQYLNQLNEYIKDYITDVDLKTFCSFLDHLTANLKIQLHGEPLKELQIMGMLESRLLDFKNIIIIGFNDENLPGINTSSTSMIPYILRKAYGIPTFEQHNAIYAYNFFRTLYRADKVSCIYNSQELISQYYYIFKFAISQIYDKFKMNRYSEKADVVTNIDNNITTDNTDSEEKDLLRIEKSGKILGILNKYQSDGTDKKTLSPSALKKYINCPLQFYFSYIVKLKESDEVSEIIDSADFGTVFHRVMELFYTEGHTDIEEAKNICEKEFLDTINATHEDSKKLYNKVILSLLNNFLESTLKYDSTRNFEFAAAEKEILFTIDKLNFKGIIDRIDIDREKKIINIIDYKTSKPQKQTKIEFQHLFSNNSAGQEVLQVLIYCKAVSESKEFCKELGIDDPENYSIRPMIYKIYDIYNDDKKGEDIREQEITITVSKNIESKMKDIFPNLGNDDELQPSFNNEEMPDTDVTCKIEDYKTWRYKNEFEFYLGTIAKDIINNTHFEPPCKALRNCTFCPYLHLCRKESEVKTF